MMYDELTGQWIPATYTGPGLCHVDILHHFANITFQIVARSVQTNEVIISSSVEKGMRYDEAEMFGSVMRTSLEVLNNGGQKRIPWPGSYEENVPDDVKENYGGTLEEEEVYEECNFETEPDEIYQDMLRIASRPLLEQNFNRLGSFRSPSRQPQSSHYSSPKHHQQSQPQIQQNQPQQHLKQYQQP